MKKVKPSDTGRFVSVYNEGQGKTDGILLEVVEDVCEVLYPHLQNEAGGYGLRDVSEVKNIVALGPVVVINVPLF